MANRVADLPTAADLLKCIETHDLGVREGKQAIWALLRRLGKDVSAEFEVLREKYRAQGLGTAVANRLTGLDIVANLPGGRALIADVRAVEGAKDGNWVPSSPEEVAETLEKMSERPRGKVFQQTVAGRERAETKETRLDRLLARVQENEKNAQRPVGLGHYIPWVTANLRTRLERIDADDVPGPEALTTLLWAQQNETAYRQLYDSKRIPAKGIAADEEKGFIDTGEPIEDIMSRISEGVVSEKTNESMRSVQAAEGNGDNIKPAGGVHGLHEDSVGGEAGMDSG